MKKIGLIVCLLFAVFSAFAMGSSDKTGSDMLGTAGTVSAKPVEFTVFLNFNNMVFNPEWKVWQEIAKRTNVSLKSVISQANSNEKEAFNLMLSSGKLADVIGYVSISDLEKLGRDGGLIHLNDLIKKHAPINKKRLETVPGFASTAYSLDGNIYFIPKDQTLKFSEFYWIRTDWLKKLGLKAPTNVDELYTVLSAFRNKDPNGNGKKDEVPLFDRGAVKAPDKYLNLFDTSTEFYARNGKMVFDPMEKEFALGVKTFAKWYKEGLVDPEFFTRGAKARDILLSGNVGGFTFDWVSTGNYNASLAKDIPGFKIEGIAPPKDPYGKVALRDARIAGAGWGISSQCKDPVTLIKFFDFFFTQEGSDLMNWGVEGQEYTRDASGKKQFTDMVTKSGQTPIGYLRSIGAQYRIGMAQDGEYEISVMSPEAKAVAQLYTDNPQWYPERIPPFADARLIMKVKPEDDARYKKIMTSIRPYVDEKFQSWVLGASDFDSDYPAFKAELEKRGIKDAIEILQRAYDITYKK